MAGTVRTSGMRAAWLALACSALAACAALSACGEGVVPGTLLCGPEMLCPEGQACNGPDNVCVLAEEARPFACPEGEPEDDDRPEIGAVLEGLGCPSVELDLGGCLGRYDLGDFYQLDVPAACAGARFEASLTFPVAFQPVELRFAAAGAAASPAEAPCSDAVRRPEGHAVRCLAQPAAAGGRYAIGAARAGPHCNGTCLHNRYRLRLRIATP